MNKQVYLSMLQPKDTIWACEYSGDIYASHPLHFSKPVFGMITVGKTKDEHVTNMIKHHVSRMYFIPFKRRSNQQSLDDLSWSKSVEVTSRHYAQSEEDAKNIFNGLIDNHISLLQEKIKEANTLRI